MSRIIKSDEAKIKRLLAMVCVGCYHSYLLYSNKMDKVKCGVKGKQVLCNDTCSKFRFSDFRKEQINSILQKSPSLKNKDDVKALLKKAKVL